MFSFARLPFVIAAAVVGLVSLSACSFEDARSGVTGSDLVVVRDSMAAAVRLFESGAELEKRGYYRQSLDSLSAAIQIFYARGEREWIAKSLLLGAQSSSYLGNLTSATDSLDVASAIIMEMAHNDRLKARLHIQIGLAKILGGNHKGAMDSFKEAAQIAKTSRSDQILTRANCMEGWAWMALGDYDNAIDQLQQTLEEINGTSEADLMNMTFCTNELGLATWLKGDIIQAENNLRRSIALRTKLWGEGHPIVNSAFVNLGIVLYTKGRYLEALALFESEIRGRTSDIPVDESLARAYSNIGLVHWKIGDPQRAIEFYKRSLAIRTQLQGEKHPKLNLLYNRLGLAYHDLRMYKTALEYHKKSLQLKLQLGRNHPELAHAYTNAGLTVLRMGDVLKARELSNKALDIRLQINPFHHDVATNYANLAETYEYEGDWNKALDFYRQSVSLELGAVDVRREEVALAILGMARCYSELSQFDAALKNLNAAVSIVDQQDNHSLPSYASMIAHGEMGRLYERNGRLSSRERAFDEYTNAVDTWMRLRTDPFFSQSNPQLLVSAEQILKDAFQNSLALYRHFASSVYHDFLLRYSELSRRSTIVDELYVGSQIKKHVPDSILTQELGLRARIRSLLLSQYQRPDSVLMADELFEARRDYDRFLDFLSRKYPRYYEYRHNDSTSIADSIRASLGDAEVLLEFFEASDSLYVIALGDTSRSVHAVGTAALREQVTQYLSALRTQVQTKYIESAHNLYLMLLAPIEPLLKGKSLIIVPDGSLHFVPFEPLLTKPVPIPQTGIVPYKSLPYLVLDHAIEYAYSATLRSFVKNRHREPAERNFLGVAPAFRDESGTWPGVSMDSVNFLPGAVDEVRSIYSMFVPWYDVLGRAWHASSTVLEGENATEEHFRSLDLSRYRYIHFATHGSVDEDSPVVSGLLLHRGSTSHDDVLRLGEIYGLNLSADLVVLSACDTGRGQVVAGEGVIGLTGGFLYAGAKNVVVSLWQVSDVSAAVLMRNFYALSLRKHDFRAALREAKLQMISSDARHAGPYHWGSYILFGS